MFSRNEIISKIGTLSTERVVNLKKQTRYHEQTC
jgi:hypothetical protein